MSSYCKKTCLLISTILLLSITTGCRVRVPPPFPPPIIVPGVTHYDRAPSRVSHHRYRYFPSTQVYFDSSRNIYFYLNNNIWLSAPLLPPHIRIDMDHYVTVELEGPKPHIHHKKTIKRYPPGLAKKKYKRKNYRKDDKNRDKEYRKDKKKYRKDERDRDKKYREEQKEYRKDDKDRDKEYRKDKKKYRKDERDRDKEYREDDKDRDKEDRKDKGKKKFQYYDEDDNNHRPSKTGGWK